MESEHSSNRWGESDSVTQAQSLEWLTLPMSPQCMTRKCEAFSSGEPSSIWSARPPDFSWNISLTLDVYVL